MYKVFLVLLVAVIIFPIFAHGQNPPGEGVGQVNSSNIGTQSSYSSNSFGGIFTNLINWFGWFVALIAVATGLYSGFLYVTGGGDDAKLTKAKQTFIYTIVGVFVAVIAFSIVAIAKLITGL